MNHQLNGPTRTLEECFMQRYFELLGWIHLFTSLFFPTSASDTKAICSCFTFILQWRYVVSNPTFSDFQGSLRLQQACHQGDEFVNFKTRAVALGVASPFWRLLYRCCEAGCCILQCLCFRDGWESGAQKMDPQKRGFYRGGLIFWRGVWLFVTFRS